MSVVVIDPPASFLDLAVVKGHLKVDGDAENVTIQLYAAAACAHIDGPSAALGRSIGPQKLELQVFDLACDVVALPGRPVRSIESVKVNDAAGVEQTIDPAGYQLEQGSTSPRLRFKSSAAIPSGICEANPVRVTYLAGYEADKIPKPLVVGALLLAGELYARKDLSGEIKLEGAAEILVGPYRVWEA